jgi:branched-chain amino acid transport system ATP-binding protein
VALLAVDGATVRFGGNLALDDVSFEVAEGRITGLIGPNGAGKTTMFNVITGLQTPTAGRVHLGGEDITKVAPHRRSQRGMARTFQRIELFGSLSARENMQVAAEIRRRGQSHARSAEERVQSIIERVGIGPFAERRADELTTGQARLVELGRALVTEPKVLLLDEPASGLDAEETEEFAALLRSLTDDGMALLLVEHDMPLVMRVCDHIYVLDYGSIIAEGTAEQIQRNQTVLDAYLGPTHEEVDA